MNDCELEAYLTEGTENIIKEILKAAARNPAAALFMMQYAKRSRDAGRLRKAAEEQGRHIPPFMIGSISQKCNLHCAGCYARENLTCTDGSGADDNVLLDAKQWRDVFSQAAELGVAFFLLAGGEPMLRQDILSAAGREKRMLFPVFTNGTMITEESADFFVRYPNLLPVLSIEGDREMTDRRRGAGVYDRLIGAMELLRRRRIVCGASITVQKGNLREVIADDFCGRLGENGCKAVIYVEYVPADRKTEALALDDGDRAELAERMEVLREKRKELLFLAFPGDEKGTGGCLAAGRGFFHINARGDAEPCPFSPYSDTNLKDVSLADALKSPLFAALKNNGLLSAEHTGGCVLFAQENKVKELLTK